MRTLDKIEKMEKSRVCATEPLFLFADNSIFILKPFCYERWLSNPFVFRVWQDYTSEIVLNLTTLLYTEITINHTTERALCIATYTHKLEQQI